MTIDAMPHNATRPADVGATGFRPTFIRTLRHAWLAGAAGGVAGFLVGGIGGRLAMFVLRLTSDERVVGAESDDGFTIGRFSSATIFLLLLTTALGAAAGLAYAAVRPALPARFRRACWATFCGAVGGSALVHKDGVDFRFLEPVTLAIAMFVVIPVAGAWLMAWLIDRWEPWWIADRPLTAVASLFTLPAAIGGVGLLVAAVLTASAATAIVSQCAPLHRAIRHLALRVTVCAGLAALAAIGIIDLSGDVAELV